MSFRSIFGRCLRLVFAGLTCALSLAFASAQTITDVPTQQELLQLTKAEQTARLVDVVRRANQKCPEAIVSLEKTYYDGTGGWLVQCDEAQDHWVTMPVKAGGAAITMPCITARATTGLDCYANFNTALPAHEVLCEKSRQLDRIISACTAIIQSGMTSRVEGLATAYVARGSAYAQYSQWDLALADYDRAAAADPSNVDAVFKRAVLLQTKGEYDQALRDLNKTLQLAPDHRLANNYRGVSYLHRAEYDRAIDEFNKAIRINPRSADAYRNRAAAFKAKGDQAKAEADMRKAKELDPSIKELVLAPSPPARPQAAAKPDMDDLPDADRQAAYCMEASSGYVQQQTRLAELLQGYLTNSEAALQRPDLNQALRTQLSDQVKFLRDNIASSETKQKQWQDNTTLYLEYLKRRDMLSGEGLRRLDFASQNAARDQRTVSNIYASCLRDCPPSDQSCQSACESKATTSDASERMLRCEQIKPNFK